MSRPACGNPWRGLLRNGMINLPNGQQKPATQPSWVTGDQTDERGYTFLQRGPKAGVERTPEELAADAAAGRTWRADAILSGARMHLYDLSTEGWIYCAPDGTHWKIYASDLRKTNINVQQPLNVLVTAERWGHWGGEYTYQNMPATLADLQQQEVDQDYPIGATGSLLVQDITPTGNKALVMIYQRSSSSFEPSCKRAMGWLLAEITGDAAGLTLTLSVVRSRAQALGTDHRANVSAPRTVYALTRQPSTLVSRVDMGDHWVETYKPTPVHVNTINADFTYDAFVGQAEIGYTNRLLALLFDPADPAKYVEIALTASAAASISAPPPTEHMSGTRVFRVNKAGGDPILISDNYVHYHTREESQTSAGSWTITRGGVAIATLSAAYNRSATVEKNWSLISATISRSETTTFDGADYTDSFAGGAQFPRAFVGGAPLWDMVYGASVVQAAWLGFGLVSGRGINAELTLARYSNNLLAVQAHVLTDTSERWVHYPAVATAHADMAKLEKTTWFNPYGSYNPATGEIERAQNTPVCWI